MRTPVRTPAMQGWQASYIYSRKRGHKQSSPPLLTLQTFWTPTGKVGTSRSRQHLQRHKTATIPPYTHTSPFPPLPPYPHSPPIFPSPIVRNQLEVEALFPSKIKDAAHRKKDRDIQRKKKVLLNPDKNSRE